MFEINSLNVVINCSTAVHLLVRKMKFTLSKSLVLTPSPSCFYEVTDNIDLFV